MNWRKLEKLIPVAAGIASPAAGEAAQLIIDEVEGHLKTTAAATGQTPDQIVAEAGEAWAKDVADADSLLKEGH